jgi:hypothetical protein
MPSAADNCFCNKAAYDLFRKKELAAIVHHMFGIFHGDVLIGRSGLESGDLPMGVAFGQFEPTDAFAPPRNAMRPARDGTGKELRDMRYLVGICARTPHGIALVCSRVEVCEYTEAIHLRGKWSASGSSRHFTRNSFRIT